MKLNVCFVADLANWSLTRRGRGVADIPKTVIRFKSHPSGLTENRPVSDFATPGNGQSSGLRSMQNLVRTAGMAGHQFAREMHGWKKLSELSGQDTLANSHSDFQMPDSDVGRSRANTNRHNPTQ